MFLNGDTVVKSDKINSLLPFNFKGSLFIGGVKEPSKINSNFYKSGTGIYGAIERAIINDKYQQDIRMEAIEIGGITRYRGFPCNHKKCNYEGVCVPTLNTFKCECKRGYTGHDCSTKQHL
jgi:hypothetical protein